MIYIVGGQYRHCMDVADDAGLSPHQWVHLTTPIQLIGTEGANVVLLDTASKLPLYEPLMDELAARSAVVWTEFELLQEGRVPR